MQNRTLLRSPGTSSSSSSTVAIGAFPSAAVRTKKKKQICEKLEEKFRRPSPHHLEKYSYEPIVWLNATLWLHSTCLSVKRLPTLFGEGLCKSPEARQTVGSQLVQDTRQHFGELLGLGVAGDGEGVGSEGRLNFGIVEVDDCSLICKHVNLQHTKISHFTQQTRRWHRLTLNHNEIWVCTYLFNTRDIVDTEFL